MTVSNNPPKGACFLAEMKEFACFGAGTQRFIRRSLDIGLGRGDVIQRWVRNSREIAAVRAQAALYRSLDGLRAAMPAVAALGEPARMIAPLIALSTFDLAQGQLRDFASYRFLYERLIGASARPWLPAAFCAAATSPRLPPARRPALLRSIDDFAIVAPTWPTHEPRFFPQWIEGVEREAMRDRAATGQSTDDAAQEWSALRWLE